MLLLFMYGPPAVNKGSMYRTDDQFLPEPFCDGKQIVNRPKRNCVYVCLHQKIDSNVKKVKLQREPAYNKQFLLSRCKLPEVH